MAKQLARIDFDKVKRDFTAVFLGSLGFSYRLISARTRMSNHQIGRRLMLAGIRLRDYRDGTSTMGDLVISRVHDEAEKRVRRFIEESAPKKLTGKK